MGNGGEESECVEERTGEKTGGNDGLGHLVPLLLFFGDKFTSFGAQTARYSYNI